MDIDSLETGQLVTDEVLLVAESKLGTDRRGQSYYSLVLNAEGGRQIEGKVWADNIGPEIRVGSGVEVLARVDEYRGARQLNIQRYRILSPEEYDFSAYVRSAQIDVDEAFETLFHWEKPDYTNDALKRLMAEFRANRSFACAFKESPAAIHHHHNYRGGLIEHTLEVWRLAQSICDLYPGRADRELVLCGAALHDIGKINSYRLVTGLSERTEPGELLEHVFISASMVSNVWDSAVRPAMPPDQTDACAHLKTLLLHTILGHHGKMEWGSPVLPRTLEAVIVHYSDVLSSTMHKCISAVSDAPQGESWTGNVYIMDQPRRFLVARAAPPAAAGEPSED
jgi:3'-5' exoribonuclease